MIELKDIVVKFGDFEALHNINVDVRDGEFFTFLGPSGCGKTTTLRTITGFIEPVSGTVNVDGRDITHVPIEQRNIGIVFQSYALFPTMTVYDNIAFGLKIQKLKKDAIDQKVHDIARKVDLSEEQLKKAVSQLSGGQQQRVAIARALVTGQAARAAAQRAEKNAAGLWHYHHLCNPRPGRGPHPVGPHRRVQQGLHRADRHAQRNL